MSCAYGVSEDRAQGYPDLGKLLGLVEQVQVALEVELGPGGADDVADVPVHRLLPQPMLGADLDGVVEGVAALSHVSRAIDGGYPGAAGWVDDLVIRVVEVRVAGREIIGSAFVPSGLGRFGLGVVRGAGRTAPRLFRGLAGLPFGWTYRNGLAPTYRIGTCGVVPTGHVRVAGGVMLTMVGRRDLCKQRLGVLILLPASNVCLAIREVGPVVGGADSNLLRIVR